MTPNIAETVIKEFVTLIRKRLEAAAGIAKAAHVCAQAGNTEGAVEIADAIGEELREARRRVARRDDRGSQVQVSHVGDRDR